MRAMENPGHVLFECPALQVIRDNIWPKLLNTMPAAMVRNLNEMTSDQKSELILSCYGGSYLPEWNKIL